MAELGERAWGERSRAIACVKGLSAEALQNERVYLLGIAYRMLGSASDAEDRSLNTRRGDATIDTERPEGAPPASLPKSLAGRTA